MFDRTIRVDARHPEKVEHHYHKPSTAQDLQLLREMRAEVEAELMEVRAPKNQVLDFRVFRSAESGRTMLCFKLNGADVSFWVEDAAVFGERSARALCEIIAHKAADALYLSLALKLYEKP